MQKKHLVRFKALCLLALVLLILVGAGVCSPAFSQPAAPALDLVLETFVEAGQLVQPLDIVHAGDERLFIVEKPGNIRVVASDGTVLPTPFLSISERVKSDGSEQGLLGLVFHPDYVNNGNFYVNYTAEPDGETHIARFQVSANDPNVADPDSEFTVLTVDQPFSNHNAGDLAFGPDGYLYIPLGDGGAGNDPGNRAQDGQTLLGKVLRIDVNNGSPYAVPADNPFVGDSDVRDEIWALGLRNPWRISFDRLTGDLFIADVGQGAWEEVNRQPAASAGGENYGWSCFEGTHSNPATNVENCGPVEAYTLPIFEYGHNDGNCSVTGGYVYRGQQYPAMAGHYFLTDYCSGILWDLVPDRNGGWRATRYDEFRQFGLSTFGEDADGELYVANLQSGEIFMIQALFAPSSFLYLPAIYGDS